MKEFNELCSGMFFYFSRFSDLRVWGCDDRMLYSSGDGMTALRDLRTNHQFIWASDKEIDAALEADRIASAAMTCSKTKPTRRGL